MGTAPDVALLGALSNAITGNAATATAFASTPSQCSSGMAPQGNAANGNVQGCTSYDPLGSSASVQTASVQKVLNGSDFPNKSTVRANLGISTVGNTGLYSDILSKPFIPTIAVTPGLIGGDNGGNARVGLFGDVVGVFITGGSCTSGYLKFDGSCSTPSGAPPSGAGYVKASGGAFLTPVATIPYSDLASIPIASGAQSGDLAAADWTTFNGKQPALGFTPANVASNGSDFTNAATFRTNIGFGNPANYPTLNQPTTANAATSSALDHVPTPCSAGYAPTGVVANGNSFGCALLGPFAMTDVGSTNALSGTITDFVESAGAVVMVKPITTNTSASTLTVNGNTRTVFLHGVALTGNEMITGHSYAFMRTPFPFRWELLRSSCPASGAWRYGDFDTGTRRRDQRFNNRSMAESDRQLYWWRRVGGLSTDRIKDCIC